ncbi:MAG: GTPase ObgE [Candidatus Absconditabacteria bacterium]|nr:GTPase ObgE [Candidatus Absconditabacteria bacterium]
MQFYDEVKITIQSGKGGDGIATGRREAGVPYGGPAGGDGGKGGSIIFKASKDENTLLPYRFKKIFKAKPGFPGRSKDQYGANAENIILSVPIGTLIKDSNGEILYVFSKDQEERTAIKGGEGGIGNIHFKDSVHQYPDFFLMGEPGQEKEIILELQLLADVALIGSPSVGKSSLINTISHSKAKVAEYPFTTLIPNLGCVQAEDLTFNVIDIPGLIKGAADGKGLGNAFLRHVLKAKIFCLISDCSRYESGIQEIVDIFDEIITYIDEKFDNPKITIEESNGMITLFAKQDEEIILEKRIIFAINKYDLINDEDIMNEEMNLLHQKMLEYFKKHKLGKKITQKLLEKYTYFLSAATHHGIQERINNMIPMLKNTKDEEVYHIPEHIKKEEIDEKIHIANISEQEKEHLIEEGYIEENQSKYTEVWEIYDPELCKLVWMIPRGNEEAEQRFRGILEHKGIIQIFDGHGIRKGDILKIKSYYANKDDRYILY